LAVNYQTSTRHLQASVWASIHANFTADTANREPLRLRFCRDTFRVVAPGTAQRTTLEENRAADTWPVLGGEALEMQDSTGGHFTWWLSRAMISFWSSLPMEVK
jgi:hypothetical protein